MFAELLDEHGDHYTAETSWSVRNAARLARQWSDVSSEQSITLPLPVSSIFCQERVP